MWVTFECIMKNVFRVFFQFSVNSQIFLSIHIGEKGCKNTGTISVYRLTTFNWLVWLYKYEFLIF